MIVQDEINMQGSSINQKLNSTMSVMLSLHKGYFCKEKLQHSC